MVTKQQFIARFLRIIETRLLKYLPDEATEGDMLMAGLHVIRDWIIHVQEAVNNE